MECPKHLSRKILCHGKTSLSWWQIINYPPPFPKTEKITPKKHHNLSSSFLHIFIRKSTVSSFKKSCCPHILLFLFPYFSPILFLQNTRKLPIYNALKEKQPQKRTKKKRTVFSCNKKNYQKKTWCLCKYTIPQAI